MALSKTKIKTMVSDWKTGLYSERELAKRHKVGRTTVRRYCKIEDKGAERVLVETIAKVNQIKSTKTVPELKSLERAVEKLTFEEKVKQDVLKKSLAITLTATSKSMEQVSKGKNLPATELHEHVKIAQRARTIVKDDQQQQPQTAINVQQLMLSEQQQTQEQTHSVQQMDEEQLIQEFKRRGLPVADNSSKAELQRLGMI